MRDKLHAIIWLFALLVAPIAATMELQLGSDHEHHESLKKTAVVVILLVILLLTLACEVLHEKIIEILERKNLFHCIEIVNTVFREMTILGLISLLLFSLTRFGIVMQINDEYIGRDRVEITGIKELTEEHENPNAAPTVLFELFEEVHIFIFFLMLTFLAILFALLLSAMRITDFWREMERLDTKSLKRKIMEGTNRRSELEYWGFKYRFMNPSSIFVPKPEADFGMSEYLAELLTKLLVELVEIPISTWVCLIPVSLLIRPVMDFPPSVVLLFLIFSSCFLLFFTLGLYVEAHRQLHYVTPNADEVKTYLLKEVQKPEEAPLAPIESVALISRASKPCVPLQKRAIINRQEAQRLFKAKGVGYTKKLLQALLFLHALAITTLLVMLRTAHGRDLLFGSRGVIVGLLPFVLVLASLCQFPFMIAGVVTSSATGFYSDRKIVKTSNERQHRRRIARSQQIMHFLLHKADARIMSQGARERNSEIEMGQERYDALPEYKQRSYQDMFHAFAEPGTVGGDKIISRQRMDMILKVFGIAKRVKDIVPMLNLWFEKLGVDKTSGLTFAQFVTVMMNFLQEDTKGDPVDVLRKRDQRLKDLFTSFDADGDGFITKEDLRDQLVGISPGTNEHELVLLMEEMAGGKYGDLLRPEEMLRWVRATDVQSQKQVPQHRQSHQPGSS